MCRRGRDKLLLVICRRGHVLQMIGLGGVRREATGCNLFRDAAACVSRERLRPISTSHSMWSTCSGGGRCLRRSRAPRARRGQPQRMCDGRGMYCGRSGGGRVLVGAIYSHIRSDQFLSLFRLQGWGSTLVGKLVEHLTLARRRRALTDRMSRVEEMIPRRLSCSDF